MTEFSYHVSHEQFSPAQLLSLAKRAEAGGFDAAFSSDHLQPWSSEQGHSGFAWAWLGAAMQATARLRFAAITVPLGWRYHPIVLAQAIATLGQMFPGRLPWVAVGSGEAINERPLLADWPAKDERNERLREGAKIMRGLLDGETVTHRGRITAVNARVWSLPMEPTRIIGAATSVRTAAWLGEWADGLLTTASDLRRCGEVIEAFRQSGGRGKPVHVKTQVSWASTDQIALENAHAQWRFNVIGSNVNWDLADPHDFERAARFVRVEDMRDAVFASSNLDAHAEHLRRIMELDVESVDIHNVGTNQAEFIDIFSSRVLPELRRF